MSERRGAIGGLERVLHLKAIPALRGLNNDALAALAESARERFHPRGSILYDEDTPVASIHHIIDGRVRLTRGDTVVTTAGPGTPLGALAVLARVPMALRGTAEVDTISLEIDSEALMEVCDDHFSVVFSFLKYVAHWIVEIERREGPQGPAPPKGARRRLADGELDLVERIFYLRRFPVFSGASINALAELSRGLTEVRFGPGVPLWSAGDAAPYALLVVDGTIDCTIPGTDVRFAAGAGWSLGTMESIAELPRWHDATTASPVVALHGAMEGLIDVFEDNVEMAMGFLALLSRGLVSYIEKRGASGVPAPA